jgi:hypothetical protein
MKVKLKARALWNTIEHGVSYIEEEIMALDELFIAVPQEMIPLIMKMETVKEAWDAIAAMRVGDDRVRRATAQQIWQMFHMAMYNEGEMVEDYALHLYSLAVHLATLGEGVKEGQIMEKMLYTLMSQFIQISISIKTLLDVSKMSMADLTRRLKEAEEALKEPPTSMQHEDKLYLMEEEWDA